MSTGPSANRARRTTAILVAALACFAATRADAQMELRKNAVSSGAGAAENASFVLGMTIGEAGAVGVATGGGQVMTQGFWQTGLGIPTDVTPLITPPGEVVHYEDGIAGATPNPFRESAIIVFTVARTSPVKLTIYDVAGRRLSTLLNEERAAGRHEVAWRGADDAGHDVAPGLYFARVDIGSWSGTQRMLRIR